MAFAVLQLLWSALPPPPCRAKPGIFFTIISPKQHCSPLCELRIWTKCKNNNLALLFVSDKYEQCKKPCPPLASLVFRFKVKDLVFSTVCHLSYCDHHYQWWHLNYLYTIIIIWVSSSMSTSHLYTNLIRRIKTIVKTVCHLLCCDYNQ